ncbi:hypothetical protein [Parapedobacter sp. 10938]|uniref:hypothetical protein n=1 Tax=Parapedobacter flavus TaxID=3110225 RepID=UPI002DB752BB|nr:hypothetical protein [Parapedobacter sp. 10938]MEC3881873.1 hypothetical protein [Parapedobacter sp. 10938]
MDKKATTQKMTRTMAGIALMITCSIMAMAQTGKTNQVHLGLTYPLSTNGKTAAADTNNLSLHLIAGFSQQENACLIAGVSGVVKGNAYGTMVSGVSNHVGGHATGVLVAGLLNQVKGEARGFQVAGLINTSGDAHTQVAGLINIAKRVEGVQVAGLINIAEQSDYPIGLLNIIRDGELALGLTVDEEGASMLALRSGGRVMYGILGLGYHLRYREARYQLTGGIGAHLITVRAFRMSAELAGTAMTSFEDGVYGKQSLRVLGGWHITPYVELIGGPTFNHLLFDADQTDIRSGRYSWQSRGDDLFNGLYFGGIIGLQFSL